VSAQHQAPTASTPGHFGHRIVDAASAEHPFKASKMKLGERIALWLRRVRGIVREFKLPRRQQINRITNALSATSNFYREKGTCRLCGADRKVIAAV
jgi:ribosomal protein S14